MQKFKVLRGLFITNPDDVGLPLRVNEGDVVELDDPIVVEKFMANEAIEPMGDSYKSDGVVGSDDSGISLFDRVVDATANVLSAENVDLITASGMPTVAAIEEEIGEDITTELRDAVWKHYSDLYL